MNISISIENMRRWSSPDSNLVLYNPDLSKVSSESMSAIYRFVVGNISSLVREASRIAQPVCLSSKKIGLIRSLMVSEKGEVFFLFNKEKKGDPCLRSSGSKKETEAIELQTGKGYRSVTINPYRKGILKEDLEGIRGIQKIKYEAIYQSSKTGGLKKRVIYEKGNTPRCLLIQSSNLTIEEGKVIFKKLIETIYDMHRRGILLCSFRPHQIFIYGRGKNIRPVITRLEDTIREEDLQQGVSKCVFSYFCSPEYSRALVSGAPREKLTKAHDIWGLGMMMCALFPEGAKFLLPLAALDEVQLLVNSQYEEEEEPAIIGTLEHTLWRMVRKNPEDRITIEELFRESRLGIEAWDQIDTTELSLWEDLEGAEP